MSRRMILAAFVVLAISATGAASAHDDPSGDGSSKCDNWYRPGHTTSTDSHEHNSPSSDINVGDPANTEIHSQSGHHVVRNEYGYVEVVGGGAYRGPDPSGRSYPGQGGYVQGEVDPGSGAPDADFHADTFGPDDNDLPPGEDPVDFVTESKAHGCVNAAGTRVAQETPEL